MPNPTIDLDLTNCTALRTISTYAFYNLSFIKNILLPEGYDIEI